MSVTHAFHNAHADGADTTVTRPSDWNAAHEVNLTASDVGADPAGSAATAQSNAISAAASDATSKANAAQAAAIAASDPVGSAASAQAAAESYADGLASHYDPAGAAASAQAASWPATTPFDATVPTTQAFGDAAAAGSATKSAHRDHLHGMPAAPSAASVGADVAGAAAAAQAASDPVGSAATAQSNAEGYTDSAIGALVILSQAQVLTRGLGA